MENVCLPLYVSVKYAFQRRQPTKQMYGIVTSQVVYYHTPKCRENGH